MTAATLGDPSRLAELRAKIDAIDESVHRLLMQRASVIDELIEVKGTARNGAAFRPGREADMMRRLAARHGVDQSHQRALMRPQGRGGAGQRPTKLGDMHAP